MQIKQQRYYNILEKEIVLVDESNYYITFPHQRAVDYYILLQDDEEVLLDKLHDTYPNMHVIMTTKAVMVWRFDPNYPEDVLSVYRRSTDEHSHFELLNTLPDELYLMVKHYEELSTTQDVVQRATLLSHIKKAKPRKRMKGKYKDVHN